MSHHLRHWANKKKGKRYGPVGGIFSKKEHRKVRELPELTHWHFKIIHMEAKVILRKMYGGNGGT